MTLEIGMKNFSMIEITHSPDITQWSEFVYNHPHGNIFQTPEVAEVYKRTKNYESISLAAIDGATGETLGVLLAVLVRVKSGFLGDFFISSVIHGGPLVVEGEKGVVASKALMEHHDKMVQKNEMYTLIRNLYDTTFLSSTLKDAGYIYEEHLNFLIDLDRPEEEIWRNIHKSRRKGINRARKKGIIIEEVKDKNILPIFYRIVEETYKNARVPLVDKSLFESAFDILVPKNRAKFYIVKYEDTFIGARLVTTYKKVVFDWYAGALINYLPIYVNEALVWHILKEGANSGYFTFDFGGAGNPNEGYGVREFKRRFGGRMVNFGRYMKVYSPIKMKIAEKGLKMYRKIGYLEKWAK